jgi:hypothetical protein
MTFHTKALIGFASAGLLSVVVACGETTPSSSSSSSTTSSPTPAVSTPAPVVEPPKWDSVSSKQWLEESIKDGMTSTFTGAETAPVTSVSCTPASEKNFWSCNIRTLGDSKPTLYRIEVAEDGSTWAGQPV